MGYINIHPFPPKALHVWADPHVDTLAHRRARCMEQHAPGALHVGDMLHGEEVAEQRHRGGNAHEGLAQEREGGKENDGFEVKVQRMD